MNSSSLVGNLYGAVFDHPEHYPQWALSALVQRLPFSQARWVVMGLGGSRELALAGAASEPQRGEFSTLRVEVLETVDNIRHEFTWQRSMPAAFTDDERRFLAETLEHLPRAERLARRLQGLLREARGGELEPVGFAILDGQGAVQSADRAFEDYLRRADDRWDGRALPFPLPEPLTTPVGIAHKGLYFRIDEAAGRLHVHVRKDRRVPSVSQREMQVARRLAAGLTFKEIARELKLAPSTVSTHAYNLYDKLGFRRRAQLVEWVSKLPADHPR